jgi:hypothetical protein
MSKRPDIEFLQRYSTEALKDSDKDHAPLRAIWIQELCEYAVSLETGLGSDVCELRDSNERLRAFAKEVLAGWPHDDGVDMGDLQDIAVAHGLLVKETRTEPCGETCLCRECDADFPVDCFRKTKLLLGDS